MNFNCYYQYSVFIYSSYSKDAYRLHTHSHLHTYKQHTYADTHTHTYTRTHKTHTHRYTQAHTCIYTYSYMRVSKCLSPHIIILNYKLCRNMF